MARQFARESRPYDFVYDSTYTVPSRADFIACVQHGAKSVAKQKIQPVFKTMFSALKTDARNIACLARMKPDVIENFVPKYAVKGMPIIPADTGSLPFFHCAEDVTGVYRYKYAMRYAEPTFKIEMEDRFGPEEQRKLNRIRRLKSGAPVTVNKSMQTVYRESEAQTEPYSPDYFLRYPGASPKLLALVNMTWEKGLPFCLDDLVIIQRALAKKELDMADHKGESEADFDKRIKRMDELEANAWAKREKEMEKILQKKIELTKRLLEEYSSRVAHKNMLRLEKLQEKLRLQSEDNFENTKHEYYRDQRKLESRYLRKKEPRHRNMIRDYTEFDSKIYAPLTRDGMGKDALGEDPIDFNLDLNDLNKLDKLTNDPTFTRRELTLDVDRFRNKLDKCKPATNTRRLEQTLEDVFLAFKDHRVPEHPPSLKQPEYKRRSAAPEVIIDCDWEVEGRKPHLVLLQKIARGRREQKQVREVLDANMKELLGVKKLWDMDPNLLRMSECELQKLLALKNKEYADERKDYATERVVGHLEGETLTRMLDFLDKEMVRLLDERKVHALILLAERERKLKEAAEGGRRYKEEERRRTNDEIFKHVIGIHQATVDMYLEEIFLESCDRVADGQSRSYVHQLASTLNEALRSARYATDFEQEDLAADLVSGFMLPEVHRLTHNRRIEATGPRYQKAAGQVLNAVFQSQPITLGAIDELEHVVEEHLQRGIAAVDGTLEMIEPVIEEAAEIASRQLTEQDKKAAEEANAAAVVAKRIKEIIQQEQEEEEEDDEEEQKMARDEASQSGRVSFGETTTTTSGEDGGDASYVHKVFDELRRKSLKAKEERKKLEGEEEEEGEGKDEQGGKEEEKEVEGGKQPEDEEEEETEEESLEFGETQTEMDSTAAAATKLAMEWTGETELEWAGEGQIQPPPPQTEWAGEVEEIPGEVEEEAEEKEPPPSPPPKLHIIVKDDVVRRLAAKSVQLQYQTEVGQHMDAVFTGASHTVDELFGEVKQKVGGGMSDDSGSDATLSDDAEDL